MKKILYWILQLTWGSISTVAGLLVTLFILIFLRKKATFHKNGYSYIIEIGEHWGGLDLGAVNLCSNYSKSNPEGYQHTRRHEFGHSIQNIIFGPIKIFIVDIPSFIRYWYHRISQKKGKTFPSDWYDKAWFEGTATNWGTWAIEKIENKKTS